MWLSKISQMHFQPWHEFISYQFNPYNILDNVMNIIQPNMIALALALEMRFAHFGAVSV